MQSAIYRGTLSCGFPTIFFSKISPMISMAIKTIVMPTCSKQVGGASSNLAVGKPRLTSGERSISEDPIPRQALGTKRF